jgi:hypothetical protein
LFGSLARGTARHPSDIDIWVRIDPLTPYALVHLKHELEELLPGSVDLVRLREQMNPSLRQRMEQQACSTTLKWRHMREIEQKPPIVQD